MQQQSMGLRNKHENPKLKLIEMKNSTQNIQKSNLRWRGLNNHLKKIKMIW